MYATTRRFSLPRRERSSPRARVRSPRLARPRRARRSAAAARTRRGGACASSRPVGGDRERDAVLDEGAEAWRAPRPRPGAPRVSRFEVGQISSTIPRSRSALISSGSRAARMPWPMRSGRSASTTSPISASPCSLALLADVDGHAEAGVPRFLDERRELAVGVAPAAWARAGDVDPDDAARARSGSPSRR